MKELIENLDKLNFDKWKYRPGSPYAPQNVFRCLVSAPTGGGKTNLISNLLIKKLVPFEKLAIFAPSLEQHLYQYLIKQVKSKMEEINKKLEAADKPPLQIEHFLRTGTSISEIPKLDELFPTKEKCQAVIIFDDMLTEKNQKIIEEYFIRSRHKGYSLFYLSQSYYGTPKLIRRQCNIFYLFELGGREFQYIVAEHPEIDKKMLIDFYKEVTEEPFGFLTIDKTQRMKWARYRNGLTGYFDKINPKNCRLVDSDSESDSECDESNEE